MGKIYKNKKDPHLTLAEKNNINRREKIYFLVKIQTFLNILSFLFYIFFYQCNRVHFQYNNSLIGQRSSGSQEEMRIVSGPHIVIIAVSVLELCCDYYCYCFGVFFIAKTIYDKILIHF